MTNKPHTDININGQLYRANLVKTPSTGRLFRNAWTAPHEAVVQIDMAAARNIHRDRMREARKERFAELDAEYMRLDEQSDNNGKRAVATKKQKLRDVTALPDLESADTPEKLRNVWPACLDTNDP